jgi:hypothetical protein
VDGLTVWQQDNSKVAIFRLRNLAPAPNTPICLNHLANWGLNGPGYPLFCDQSAIGALPDGLKVTCDLHATKVTECGRRSICHLTLALSGQPRAEVKRVTGHSNA